MPRAFLVTLLPIIGASLLLVGIVLSRRPRRVGLAGAAAAVAGWAASVLLTLAPETRPLGERLFMVGFFVPVGFLVAAREARREVEPDARLPGGRPALVAAIALSIGFFVVGLAWPHAFVRDGGAVPGPAFFPMFATAGLLSLWPLLELVQGLRHAREGGRERLRYLLLAGTLSCFGGGINVLLLLLDQPSPLGLTLSLCGVALLAWAVRSTRLPAFGRFVEGSLRYSVVAAGLSTAYLFAVLVFLRPDDAGLGSSEALGAAAQLFVLVLVGQPFLAGLRAVAARRLLPGASDVGGLAKALAESEARADHAGRLAEIGALAGAVAHEVRNPLGVIQAATHTLARAGAPEAPIAEIREQVARASAFADELLEYGRPAPLTRRPVDVAAAAALAASELQRALPLDPPATVSVEGSAPPIQGDLGQIIRLAGILIENAMLASHRDGVAGRVQVRVTPTDEARVRLTVTDDGPGVPEALRERLFAPFISGRGRGGPRPGTGLGLAIARGIAERHGGALVLDVTPGPLGGACFSATLPCTPPAPPAEG